MRKFTCPSCAGQLYFENFACGRCGSGVEFNPLSQDFEAWTSEARRSPATIASLASATGARIGAATAFAAPANSTGRSRALDADGNLELWKRLEVAKRRVLYDLGRLGLSAPQRGSEGEFGLAFDFLSPADGKVVTGHDSGLITINLAEADDAHREQIRTELGEPYRTLVGHFRHECGHYLFDRFVAGGDELGAVPRDVWRRTPRLRASAEGLLRAPARMAARISSPPMRPPIPGRIGPRAPPIISISSRPSTRSLLRR